MRYSQRTHPPCSVVTESLDRDCTYGLDILVGEETVLRILRLRLTRKTRDEVREDADGKTEHNEEKNRGREDKNKKEQV